jgi:hypothetical protein
MVDIFKLETDATDGRKRWMFVDRIFYEFNRMLYASSLFITNPAKAADKVTITTGDVGTLYFKNSTDITLFEQSHSVVRKIEPSKEVSSITTFSLNEKGLFSQIKGNSLEKAYKLSVQRKFEPMYRDSLKNDILNSPTVEVLSGFYH